MWPECHSLQDPEQKHDFSSCAFLQRMATYFGTIFFKDILGVRMKGNINLENSGIFPLCSKVLMVFLIICLILDQINSL